MATEKSDGKRRGGGGKLSRSETVTVRLDPKLRYLAELAARKQRRTLSSYIEKVVEESLSHVTLIDRRGHSWNLAEAADSLWDVDVSDRLAKLAIQFHELLTHEEQVLWKLVRESEALWMHSTREGEPVVAGERFDQLILPVLRMHWATFVRVARGELDKSLLLEINPFD
jgi:hypothetical protein